MWIRICDKEGCKRKGKHTLLIPSIIGSEYEKADYFGDSFDKIDLCEEHFNDYFNLVTKFLYGGNSDENSV